MSAYVWSDCACGVRIVAISNDEDDVRLAVAAHIQTRLHQEWRAVQTFKEIHGRRTKGPCICKGGEARQTASADAA